MIFPLMGTFNDVFYDEIGGKGQYGKIKSILKDASRCDLVVTIHGTYSLPKSHRRSTALNSISFNRHRKNILDI